MRLAVLLTLLFMPLSAVAEQQHYFILFTTDSTPVKASKKQDGLRFLRPSCVGCDFKQRYRP
jgi:hypothetical protein